MMLQLGVSVASLPMRLRQRLPDHTDQILKSKNNFWALTLTHVETLLRLGYIMLQVIREIMMLI